MSEAVLYLAGPVAALEDGGAGWREDASAIAARRGLEVRDPLSKFNAPAEDIDIREDADADDAGEVTPTEIVESDKELLWQSDAVLVGYEDVHSVGTPMEVMWASERDYPIVVWVRDETDVGELSPWYRYHADEVTTTLRDAMVACELRLGHDD